MPLLKKLYVNFETYLCVALIAVMIVCLTLQVGVRIVSGSAVAWAEEVSRYCFICAVYLGTAVGAQRLAHVRITAQFMFLPVRARLAFRMIADVILFAFNIFLAWLCFDIVSESIRLGGMSATLGINVAYVEAVVPIGAVLMNWRILESYYLHWRDGTLAKLVAIETDLGLATQEGEPIVSVLTVLLVSMSVLFLIGVPIYAALAIAAALSLATSDILPMAVIQSSFYDGMNIFPLLAIPCFIVAGALMERGNITSQIINVVRILVGRIYGGIGITTILACAVFASITGSATSTVAAIGAIMVPAMMRNGYSPAYAGACSASGGTIGILIPPSNPMIIYAIMANVSISGMFAAGFLPGLIMAAALAVAAYLLARRKGFKADESIGAFSFLEFLKVCKTSFFSLATVVIVLGSIYSGLATPVEASIVAVVWALFVGTVINRALSWRDIYDSLVEGVMLCGSITIIVGASTLFGKILTYEEAPVRLANFMIEMTRDKYAIILLIVAMLYLLGMFVETLAMVIIVTPVLVPVLVELDIDLIHFGIIMVIANEVGLLTPPMGVNLFVASRLTGTSVERLSVTVLPYIGVMTLVILLVIFCPSIATFVPRLLGF